MTRPTTSLKPRVRRPLVRVLIIWAAEALALAVLALVMERMQIDRAGSAIVTAAVIGLLNAVLWPFLSYIVLPFAVVTFGLATWVLNGVIVYLAGLIVPGFHVETIGAAMLVALGMTAVNVIVSTVLTIDDDASYFRGVVQRRMRGRAEAQDLTTPGVIFLEIDGLSKPVLEKAMAAGYAPTMKRWLDEQRHTLAGWEPDLSAQTSASQAGLLHGNNHNIPAFRWYDRQREIVVASSDPDQLSRIEKELSDGNGLLADGGASRGNLFSGDATSVMATASTMKDLSKLKVTDFRAYFLDPYNFTRTLLLFFWDIILEKRQFAAARKAGVEPLLDRHHRGGVYPLLRGFTTVIMRELNTYTLIGDMFAGVPAAYATFVGYDEVAHHSGVESPDALDALRKLDEQFGRLERAAAHAPREYRLVVLSDHGQSGGKTFKQRYGMSLEDVVKGILKHRTVGGDAGTNEDWGHLNVFLTDAVQGDRVAEKTLGRALEGRTQDGQVLLGPESHEDPNLERDAEGELPHVLVLASGNLGLVYSTRRKERLTLEELEENLPGLLEVLVAHPGIGFVMVHSTEHGPVVVGAGGRHHLRSGQVEGADPLAPFGPNAARHLIRNDGFPDAPDVYVNSFYDAQANEVAAFEELIGCHGGLGGYQTQPFVLYPRELPYPEETLVGASAVHRALVQWLPERPSGAGTHGAGTYGGGTHDAGTYGGDT